MTLNIKYFGMLAEVTNCETESLAFSGNSVSDLLSLLFKKYPQLEGKDFQVAQDNRLIPELTIITHSEIALLPPFSGG